MSFEKKIQCLFEYLFFRGVYADALAGWIFDVFKPVGPMWPTSFVFQSGPRFAGT